MWRRNVSRRLRPSAFNKAAKALAPAVIVGSSKQTNKLIKEAKKMGKKKPTAKKITKRVAKLEKQVKGATSVLTYKADTAESVRPAAAGALNGYRDVIVASVIETAIAQCRFFDPSNPGTLITGSLATPTYQQKVRVAVYTKTQIKNSYMVPCVVTYGVVVPRQATSVSPTVAWTSGLADQGNPTNTSYLLGMSDSKLFKQLWHCKQWRTKVLMPGQSVTVVHNQPAFDYDPAYQDSETETYNKREKAACVFYRIKGVLSHDTANLQIGVGASGVDVHSVSVYKVYYNSGGAAIDTIVLSQGATSLFTNGAVSGMKDIPDNIAYSVA